MKTKICIIFLGLLPLFNLFSAPGDSIVRFADLSFKNDLEKNTFKKYSLDPKNTDIIDLFLAHYTNRINYSSSIAHKQILEYVNSLSDDTRGMTEKRKVKYVFKNVHKRFFKFYNLVNSYSDIFEKGAYNCVSGSAMYGIIFQQMKIPYQVVEAPQHVFLFAYPQTHKIMIETTAPKNGYFAFSDNYIEKFVKYLHESGVISKNEFVTTSANELFNKYYFAKQGMSLQDLAGIQYSNYGFYYLENKEYDKALEEVKKSHFINSNARTNYMLQVILYHIIANRSYKEKKDFDNLVLLCRFNNNNKKDFSNEFIINEFGRLTYEHLVVKPDHHLYDEAFALIHPIINDSVLRNEIAFIYHYELARLGNNNFKSNEYVFSHLKSANKLNNKHEDLHLIIKSHFSKTCEHINTSAILKNVEVFTKSFDFLRDDVMMLNVRANCLADLSYQSYATQDRLGGEDYLQKFESLCDENKNIKPDELIVERTYSTAAAYYFKKGNKVKTREVLKSGIKHAPESFGLMLRLNQVK